MSSKLYIQCRLYNVNNRLAALDLYDRIVEWIKQGLLVDMEEPFLPYKSSNNADTDDEHEVFERDRKALASCNGVTGFFDGWTYDPGAGWEIGCGYAFGYPIDLVSTDIFRSSVGDSSKYYQASKYIEHIAKIVTVSDFDKNIKDYRKKNEDVLERAMKAYQKNLIEDFGKPRPPVKPIKPLPVEYDYYLDPNFKYTEAGRDYLAKIIEQIISAKKTYVMGDNAGDIAADLINLRKSREAILYFDIAEPNIDSSVLQGIAFGMGRRPIVYASNMQRIFMSGKWSIQLNTMNHYSARVVATSMEMLLSIIKEGVILDKIAATAALEAMKANCQGTFSVGGLLMDKEGSIIHQLHNNVVVNDKVYDPTAHGERQLIDWYFENKESKKLPEPQDLFLVTSLDPCCMCAGASLIAGFNRVVVAANDTSAGINYDLKADYPTLVGTPMHDEAKKLFSYPKVVGETCFKREKSGAELPKETFTTDIIDEKTQALCSSVFLSTLFTVQEKIKEDDDPSKIIDPYTLPADHPIRILLKLKFENAFLGYRGPKGNPGREFAEYLYKPKPFFDGISYFDCFGNLIFTERAAKIPTQTAFMNATRKYAQVRRLSIQGFETRKYLCHPKHGYFVMTFCPDISKQTLMELGAFGSTMEGLAPNPIQFILKSERSKAVNEFIAKMPPLYSKIIKIRVDRTPDQEMVDRVQYYYDHR